MKIPLKEDSGFDEFKTVLQIKHNLISKNKR